MFFIPFWVRNTIRVLNIQIRSGCCDGSDASVDLFAFGLEWKLFIFHFWDKPLNHIWVKKQRPVRRGWGWVTVEARPRLGDPALLIQTDS